MDITMTIVTARTTDEIKTLYPDEADALDSTCSMRCFGCNERMWLRGSWWDHYTKIIECPKCKRLHLASSVRRTDLEKET